MEERAESMKPVRSDKSSSNFRKNKKRGIKKNVTRVDGWYNEDHRGISSVPTSSMDYDSMFWQQTEVPPHIQPSHNGQRLFTAMSDPSVCGYSTMPVAYTMEPVSMPPIYPLYRPVPRPNYRTFRGRPRINVTQSQHHVAPHANQHSNMVNGYTSLQDNRLGYLVPPLYQNGDYTSLPPSANNHVANGAEELNSEHRRYSDPGLGPADLPTYQNSDDSDSGESGSSITTVGKNNKLVLSLVEQMTTLRETNSQMFRELHETKLSMENMRTELVRVKQHTTADYQPGMLSDIISEIREANKLLNETLMIKVNAMIEEKNHQTLLELDQVKAQLAKMSEEKAEVVKRITKLEEDINALRVNFNNEDREIAAFEEETLKLQQELQVARSSRNYLNDNATKCVDASIFSSLMRVNFDTPCITSTPVRTDILNSCCVSSAGCHTSSSSTSSNSSPLPFFSSSNSLKNMTNIDGAEIDKRWQWSKCDTSESSDSLSESALRSPGFTVESNCKKTKDLAEMKFDVLEAREKNNGRKKSVESTKSMEPDEKEALEKLIYFHFNREQSLGVTHISSEKKIDNSHRKNIYPNNTKKRSSLSCVNSATMSSSSLGIDEIIKKSIEGVTNYNNTETSELLKKDGSIEIPDVVVVAGKSVVPKHLCSTRILKSRVLTAPSRTTYTTAYI